jgi:hypothetical protein
LGDWREIFRFAAKGLDRIQAKPDTTNGQKKKQARGLQRAESRNEMIDLDILEISVDEAYGRTREGSTQADIEAWAIHFYEQELGREASDREREQICQAVDDQGERNYLAWENARFA